MARHFGLLNPNQIECRIGIVKQGKGVSLLLYKTARTDYEKLDEAYGEFGWKCEYREIMGSLFCTISVWDDSKKQWVSKENCGTESNTEAEKGRASDALKRAGFAWGCGTELYSAPFIWVNDEDIRKDKNNKIVDTFVVDKISYDKDENIEALVIKNDSGKVVYQLTAPTVMPSDAADEPKTENAKNKIPTCELCDGIIEGYTYLTSGGEERNMSAEKHIKLSMTRYDGHIYCHNCIEKNKEDDALKTK